MTDWQTRTTNTPGEYAIRWRPRVDTADGKSYSVEFAVVQCMYTDMGGANPHYGNDPMSASPDLTTAESEVHGSVKWDGCINWQATEEGMMLHHCGEGDLESLMAAILEAHREAMKLMGEP
jgi:hypothetical protein